MNDLSSAIGFPVYGGVYKPWHLAPHTERGYLPGKLSGEPARLVAVSGEGVEMLNWDPIAGWMGFPYLSQSAGLERTFTLAYRLKDDTNEAWTRRFNRFKSDERAATWGGGQLLYGAVPGLIEAIGVKKSNSVFVPALSSREKVASSNRAIPFIAKECARQLGIRYDGGALTKNPHQKIHTLYNVDARNAELDKAEYKCTEIAEKNVFIFDDFITRGDTLSRIAQSILAENPKATVYGVALAKNESLAYCPNPTNDHVPVEWAKLWEQGEREYARQGK